MPPRDRPVIAISIGDPAGVGPEVCVSALEGVNHDVNFLLVGDADVLRAALPAGDDRTIRSFRSIDEVRFDESSLNVLDLGLVTDVKVGTISGEYGDASVCYLERAMELAIDGVVDAITSAPVNARSIRLGDREVNSFNDLIVQLTGVQRNSILLVKDAFRVSHVTIHSPLREVPALLSADIIYKTIRMTETALEQLGDHNPCIAVAGLNPHAGFDMEFGREERDSIRPAVQRAERDGIEVTGPESPDTVFSGLRGGKFDAVVAMYHDQGHIPFKLLSIQQGEVTGASVRIGLPFLLTSVPHGPAMNIAGEGKASDFAMRESLDLAARAVSP